MYLMNLLSKGPRTRIKSKKSRLGLIIGVLLGSFFTFCAFPNIRDTFIAQINFATQQNSFPWIHWPEHKHNSEEIKRLDRVAADASADYLVQVGRATALAGEGGLKLRPGDVKSGIENVDYGDRTLYRLHRISLGFPSFPGAYGHLTRYMMSDRVRIIRKELPSAEAHSTPARLRDVRLMEWAIREGSIRDPQNAFWSAMLATTYFAAGRDSEGIRELAKIQHNARWDAYIYEEVLGQWKLYSLAYGDNGAAQKIGPLSLVAFPHLREIRHMAELARWHAEKLQSEGRYTEALRIRSSISRLGIIMRDSARWAYEALFGTDLVFIAYTDSAQSKSAASINSLNMWEKDASGFLTLLELIHRKSNLPLIRREIQISCDLRDRIDLARSDASFPGIPPGIPLMPLFADWMAGVCIIQQTATLAILWIVVAISCKFRLKNKKLSSSIRNLGTGAFFVIAFTSGGLQYFGVSSIAAAEVFYISIIFLLLMISENWVRRRSISSEDEVSRNEMIKLVQTHWTNRDTFRSVLNLFLPVTILLYFSRPFLSHLHPAAMLLSAVLTSAHFLTVEDTLRFALISLSVPIGMVILATIWSIRRYVFPTIGLQIWMQRTVISLFLCLSISYLVLISRTLSWDASASIAINQEAENDLQWILTHNSDS